MTIQNEKAFMKGVWDWAILDGCIGNSNVTDIDGLIERNGHFFVMETKTNIHTPIKTGQMIALQRMAQTGKFNVALLWGDKTPEAMQIIKAGGEMTEKCPANLEVLRKYVAAWYAEASNRKAPHIIVPPMM